MKSLLLKLTLITLSHARLFGAQAFAGPVPAFARARKFGGHRERLFFVGCLLISALLWAAPLSSQGATATIGSNGIISINGQPSFPFGFYHVSDAKPAGTGDTTRTVDLVNMASGGFDLFEPVIDAPDINTDQLLIDANNKGVKVIAQFWWTATNQSYRSSFVTGHASTPAIIGWSVGDDVNIPTNAPHFTPAQIRARTQEILGYSPNQLTYGAFLSDPATLAGAAYPLASYAGCVSIVGIESYPIAGGNATQAEELEYNASTYLNARAAFRGTTTTYLAIPQTFSWGSRWPTNAESRNLLYVSFIYGASGAVCYTYYDGTELLPSADASLWTYFRNTLRPEVTTLKTAFATGKLTNPTGLPSHVHAGIWSTANQTYVVVANTSRSAAASVSIPLAATVVGPATPVFTGEPSGLVFSGGKLMGTVQPTDVHVYVLNNSGSTAPTPTPTATPAPGPSPSATPIPTPSATPSSSPTASPTPTSGKADLVVTSLTWTPTSPAPGAPVTFSATVKNQGTVATPVGKLGGVFLGVGFQIDGQWVTWSDNNYGSLAPGASITLTPNFGTNSTGAWTSTAGTHTVTAIVDNMNVIPESNESNNTLSKTIIVGATAPTPTPIPTTPTPTPTPTPTTPTPTPAPIATPAPNALPDLVITNLTWTPASPASGSQLAFSATVKNQGSAATPVGKAGGVFLGVGFQIDGQWVTWSDNDYASLAPGASITLTANFGNNSKATWPAVSGTHTVTAIVDNMNLIPESNKGNNTVSKTVVVP